MRRSILLCLAATTLVALSATVGHGQYNRPTTLTDTSWLPTNYGVWRIRPGQKERAAKIDIDTLLAAGTDGAANDVLKSDGNGKVSWGQPLTDITGNITATGSIGLGTGHVTVSGYTNNSITMERTSAGTVGFEFSSERDDIADAYSLGGIYWCAGTAHNNVAMIHSEASGTSENGAYLTFVTSAAGVSYGHRFMADGDVSLGSTSDSGKDFAVYAGTAWTGFNQGDAGLSSSSSPSLKWGARPVTQDTVEALREVFAQLPMQSWSYRTEVVRNDGAIAAAMAESTTVGSPPPEPTFVDRLGAAVGLTPPPDQRRAEWEARRSAWQGKVERVRAAVQSDAVRLANLRHTGLMAPDAARVSRLISPDEVDSTTTNTGHLLNASVVLIGDLIRRQAAQEQRIAALEERIARLERGRP